MILLKSIKYFIFTCFSLCLIACASGPVFSSIENTNPQEDALVYVYRPHSIANSGVSLNAFINFEKIGPLKGNGYLVSQVPAGKIRFALEGGLLTRATFGTMTSSFEAKPGEIIFLRMDSEAEFNYGSSSHSISIVQIDNASGFSEIEYMKLSQ